MSFRLPVHNAAVLFALAAGAANAQPARLAAEAQTAAPRIERFVAADAFRLGGTIGDRKVSLLGLDFQILILPSVETRIAPMPLQAWTLRYSLDDTTLLKTLGGEANATLPLAAIHHVMTLGEEGGSRVDWRSNFAYVRLADGQLRAIHWFVNHEGEWVIGAAPVPHPNIDWPAGSRVFSRAPVEPMRVGKVSDAKR